MKNECSWVWWRRATLGVCAVLFALSVQAVSLPYGYTRLEYVETTEAGQYVKTGYTPKAGDKVTCVCWVKKVQANGHHWATIFGSRVTNTASAYLFFTHQGDRNGSKSAYGRSFETNGSQEQRTTAFTFEQKTTLVCDGRTATWTSENGTTGQATFSFTDDLVDAGCPLYLFDLNIGAVGGDAVHSSCYCQGRIYAFSAVSDAGETLIDFVPCRTPEGVVGFFDTVAGEFHGNAGGDRLYGADDMNERVSFIRSTGTQYIKTGYIPKGVDRIDCVTKVAKVQHAIGSTSHHWATIFGARTGNANVSYTFFSHASSANGANGVEYNRSAGASGSTGVNSKAFPYDKKVTLVCDGATATWTKMEDGTTGSINLGITPVDSTCSLFLFCLNIGAAGAELVHNSCYCEMDLSSFKVTTPASGDAAAVVQRDYVAGRTMAGVVGLFDRAHNNGFVSNAGTGAFGWGGLAFTERGTTLIAREGTLSADDLVGYTDVEKPTWKTVNASGVASYPGSLTLAGGLFALTNNAAQQTTVAGTLVLKRGMRLAVDFEGGFCDRFAVGGVDLSDLSADDPAYIEVNDVAGLGTLAEGAALPLVSGTGLSLTAADAKKFRVAGLGAKVAVLNGALVLVAPRADDVVWTGTTEDGRWFTDGNWQDGAAPEPGAGVFFPTGSGTTTFDIGGLVVRTVAIGAAAGSFTQGGAERLAVTASITNASPVAQAFQMPLLLGVENEPFALDVTGPLSLVGGVNAAAAQLVKTGAGELTIDDSAVAQAGDLHIEGGSVKLRSTDALQQATPGEIHVADGTRLDINVAQGGVVRLARTEATHGKRLFVAGAGPDGTGALYNSELSELAGCTFSHVTLTGNTRAGGGAMDIRPLAGSACGATDASLSGGYTLTTACSRFAVLSSTFALDSIVNEGQLIIGGKLTGAVTNGIHFVDGSRIRFDAVEAGQGVPLVFEANARVSGGVYGDSVFGGSVSVETGTVVQFTNLAYMVTLNGEVRLDGTLEESSASGRALVFGGTLEGVGTLVGGQVRFQGAASRWRMRADENGFTEKVDIAGVADEQFWQGLANLDVVYTGGTAETKVFDLGPAGSFTGMAAAKIALTVTDAHNLPVRNCWLGVSEGVVQLHVADARLPRTAIWVGGGRMGDPSDPANWQCVNDGGATVEGALPLTATSVRLAGETTLACPVGTTFACKELVLQGAVLGADCDWRGLDLALVPSGGTIDLAGHDLQLTLTASPAQSLTFTDSSVKGEGGALRLSTATTVVNEQWSFTGSMKLVTDGTGTFVAKVKGQTYSGGTEVAGGTFALFNDAPNSMNWAGDQHLLGAEGSVIDVDAAGHFNTHGNYELTRYAFRLNGGWLENTDVSGLAGGMFNQTAMDRAGIGNITLTTDSTLYTRYDMFVSDGVVDLGGHTLTNLYISGKTLYWGADAINGTIVTRPYWGAVTDTAAFWIYKRDLDLRTVSFDMMCCFNIPHALSVNNYVSRQDNGDYHKNISPMNVYGTFAPLTDCFYGCTLQNGATLDLSAQTGVWSTINRFQKGTTNVTFAVGAKVKVDVTGRDLKPGDQVVAWPEKPDESVRFVATVKQGWPRVGLSAQEKGLFCVSNNTVIFIR